MLAQEILFLFHNPKMQRTNGNINLWPIYNEYTEFQRRG